MQNYINFETNDSRIILATANYDIVVFKNNTSTKMIKKIIQTSDSTTSKSHEKALKPQLWNYSRTPSSTVRYKKMCLVLLVKRQPTYLKVIRRLES